MYAMYAQAKKRSRSIPFHETTSACVNFKPL